MLARCLICVLWCSYSANHGAAVSTDLVLVISLSRHGSRAPNPTIRSLCPANLKNFGAYAVPPEQLTDRGMEQLQMAGEHVRHEYIEQQKFLSPNFDGPKHEHFETYFRADSAVRCGQSAVALGYGLYPDGTGPGHFRRQPIPVYMQLSENEHDFGAGGPCWRTSQEHLMRYAAEGGKRLILQRMEMLKRVGEVCGSRFYDAHDPILAIKDVADMLLFDQDAGLPTLPGMTAELMRQINQLSFQHLVERLYTTNREVVYACGGFPTLIIRNIHETVQALSTGRPPLNKYYSYHGHRELLHGLGFMLGHKFYFDGLPEFDGSTPLIPGTTLFFELHRNNTFTTRAPLSFYVTLYVWSPKTNRTLIKLASCAAKCPLQQFEAIITDYILETGTWQEICKYHPISAVTQLSSRPAMDAKSPDESRLWELGALHPEFGWAICASLFLYLIMSMHRLRKRRYYRTISFCA